MIISYRGTQAGEWPIFQWKRGEGHICRLKEVEVWVNSRGIPVSSPIYDSLFSVEQHPGSTDLFAVIRGRLVNVSVTGKWPWLKVFIFKEDD